MESIEIVNDGIKDHNNQNYDPGFLNMSMKKKCKGESIILEDELKINMIDNKNSILEYLEPNNPINDSKIGIFDISMTTKRRIEGENQLTNFNMQ